VLDHASDMYAGLLRGGELVGYGLVFFVFDEGIAADGDNSNFVVHGITLSIGDLSF
jgi:hypothetical protein